MANKKGRTKFIQIRVTEEEYTNIKEKANSLVLDISDYMRMVAILAKVDVKCKKFHIEKEGSHERDNG